MDKSTTPIPEPQVNKPFEEKKFEELSIAELKGLKSHLEKKMNANDVNTMKWDAALHGGLYAKVVDRLSQLDPHTENEFSDLDTQHLDALARHLRKNQADPKYQWDRLVDGKMLLKVEELLSSRRT